MAKFRAISGAFLNLPLSFNYKLEYIQLLSRKEANMDFIKNYTLKVGSGIDGISLAGIAGLASDGVMTAVMAPRSA